MPNRGAGGVSYRYGFNGKETENDVKGIGNEQDYGMRIYDPRLGRFLSVDPLVSKYPELTPYQFASNMPIIAVDLDGEEGKIVTIYHSALSGKEFFRTEKADNSPLGFLINTTITIHKYPIRTPSGLEWRQMGVGELSLNHPANFQTGRIDLSMQTLGKLSERYESSGPGTVSSGIGDFGGISYGSWQLASNMGSPDDFLKNEGAKYKEEFGDAKPGSKEFTKIWKGIAVREPMEFKASQHSFIKRRDYDLMVNNVRNETGIDVNSRSAVLRDVVWSTAVQHGGKSTIIQRALQGHEAKDLDDATIIKLIYAERGRKNKFGELAHFTSSSKEVQESVSKRYEAEMQEALKRLNNK